MSWVTDARVAIHLGEVGFVVGPTVLYTSLLLGVFVVYVFDGPAATRMPIVTVAAVSALTPLLAAILQLQAGIEEIGPLQSVPVPNLRINAASVVATLGLLPICSRCKRIRDGKGYWNLIEAYLKEHTHAELTHGICPGCARELYPEMDEG